MFVSLFASAACVTFALLTKSGQKSSLRSLFFDEGVRSLASTAISGVTPSFAKMTSSILLVSARSVSKLTK